MHGQPASAIDTLPARVAEILNRQLALIRPETLQAWVETRETFLTNDGHFIRVDGSNCSSTSHVMTPRFVEGHVPAIAAHVFKQDKSCNHIAIASGGTSDDPSALFERPGDSVQRLVCEIFSRRPIPAIEIQHEPPANLEIRLTMRVAAIVEPFEQSTECELRKSLRFS